MYRKRSNPNCNGTRRNKVALKTTCIKKVKFNIIKIRTGCQYIGHFLQRKPKLGAQNLRLGRGLDIAVLESVSAFQIGFDG